MHGVDEETRKAVLNRLKRIEGQIRGLQKMVENEFVETFLLRSLQ